MIGRRLFPIGKATIFKCDVSFSGGYDFEYGVLKPQQKPPGLVSRGVPDPKIRIFDVGLSVRKTTTWAFGLDAP